MKTEPKIKPSSLIALMVIFVVYLTGTFAFVKYLSSSATTSSNNNEMMLSKNILKNSSKKQIKSKNNDESISTNEIASVIDNTTENNATDENNTVLEVNKNVNSAEHKIDENTVEKGIQEKIVYDGLTKQQLVDKLNKNLNATIAGTGELFANYALELGMDPYLAVAIVLHETGCSWDCSNLVKACYNVGGQKGSPGCGGSSYIAYSSLEEGISSFMHNLYDKYYSLGLTTPETINPKYAASTTWASSINNYINKIKAS